MKPVLSFLVPLAAWTAAQGAPSYTLSSVLSGQNQLTNFTSFLSQYPTLSAQLEAGNVTVLAPSDEAFAKHLNSGDAASNGSDELGAILTYHILQGIHAELLLSKPPQFIPTLLSNQSYTNVTGGQRVEAAESDDGVVFYSAVKAISKLISPDIVYNGGLIHIIDSVLAPPIDVVNTATKAKLNGFTALLAGTAPNPQLSGAFGSSSDLTFFVPNTYDGVGFDNVSDQLLWATEEYSVIPGVVAYSSLLTNGQTFKTLQGGKVTITVQNNSIYVDSSRIVDPDYLTSNGVLQILDIGLDPSKPSARPSPLSTPHTTSPRPSVPTSSTSLPAKPSPQTGLGTGAKAGIGIGATIGALAVIVLAWYFFGKHKGYEKQRAGKRRATFTFELAQGDKYLATELEGEGPVYEMGDGR